MKACLGLGDLLLRGLTQMAVGKMPQCLCHMGLSVGLLECPHSVAAGFPVCKWSRREQSGNHNFFCDLALEIAHHHFYNILVVIQINFIHYGRGVYIRMWIPGDGDHWGHLGDWSHRGGSGFGRRLQIWDMLNLGCPFYTLVMLRRQMYQCRLWRRAGEINVGVISLVGFKATGLNEKT